MRCTIGAPSGIAAPWPSTLLFVQQWEARSGKGRGHDLDHGLKRGFDSALIAIFL
jgi:hypothetical protein